MGGKMWVISSGKEGEGSEFHFTISTPLAIEEQNKNNFLSLAGKTVLIVDDNQTNREILTKQMHSLKMIPETVGSAKEALEILLSGKSYDVAILDYQMPEMDGIKLAEKIFESEKLKKIPLLLLSSVSFKEKYITMPQFAAILTKPIKLNNLHQALFTILVKDSKEQKKEKKETMFNTEVGERYPLRILLAEDNLINQKVALRFLEKAGYTADVAFNGLEVLAALKLQKYDVILMDIQMPELDGEQAAIEIRNQLPQDNQPIIIAVTANAVKEDIERYIEKGMNKCIIKPFKIEELVNTLIDCYYMCKTLEEDKLVSF
jgi:CheY-like chemotaxis protein